MREKYWGYLNSEVPQRLQKIHRNGPIFMLSVFLSALFLIPLGTIFIEKFNLGQEVLYAVLCAVLLILSIWFWLRQRRLELEVIRDLPPGWHLIYRYQLSEERYRPDLVHETNFKRTFSKSKKWYEWDEQPSVRMSRQDKTFF